MLAPETESRVLVLAKINPSSLKAINQAVPHAAPHPYAKQPAVPQLCYSLQPLLFKFAGGLNAPFGEGGGGYFATFLGTQVHMSAAAYLSYMHVWHFSKAHFLLQ